MNKAHPGGAEWVEQETTSAQIYLKLWPSSPAPAGTQIRNACPEGQGIEEGWFGPEIEFLQSPLALRLVYEDGFWVFQPRAYA